MDQLLQNESFEEPIIKGFNTKRGRPTVPVRVYIRLMFLKYYLGLSFEDLIPEVTHNLMYRFFCRIPLEQKVPDNTALMKITTKYGEDTISEINQQFAKIPGRPKDHQGAKLRVDTTVVETNIAHPTDAGLLYEGVKSWRRQSPALKNPVVKRFAAAIIIHGK